MSFIYKKLLPVFILVVLVSLLIVPGANTSYGGESEIRVDTIVQLLRSLDVDEDVIARIERNIRQRLGLLPIEIEEEGVRILNWKNGQFVDLPENGAWQILSPKRIVWDNSLLTHNKNIVVNICSAHDPENKCAVVPGGIGLNNSGHFATYITRDVVERVGHVGGQDGSVMIEGARLVVRISSLPGGNDYIFSNPFLVERELPGAEDFFNHNIGKELSTYTASPGDDINFTYNYRSEDMELPSVGYWWLEHEVHAHGRFLGHHFNRNVHVPIRVTIPDDISILGSYRIRSLIISDDWKFVNSSLSSRLNIVDEDPDIPYSITITNPRGGEKYRAGQDVIVRYHTEGFPRRIRVQIQLNKGARYPGGPYNPILSTDFMSATGSYRFTLPEDLITGDDYSFHIVADYPSTETGPIFYSDNFSVSGEESIPQITILSPRGGENFIGAPRITDTITGFERYRQDITWLPAPSNPVEAREDYKVFLERQIGSRYATVGRIPPFAIGSISWVVGIVSNVNCDLIYPSSRSNNCFNRNNLSRVAPGRYRIRLEHIPSGQLARSADFDIRYESEERPQIKVVAPSRDSILRPNRPYSILWNSSGLTNNVEIYLRDDRAGPHYKLIETEISNRVNSYTWTVPQDFMSGDWLPGDGFKIQVREIGGPAGGGPGEGIFGESDYFTITADTLPAIHSIEPGAIDWGQGVSRNITIDATGVDKIDVFVCIQGGSCYWAHRNIDFVENLSVRVGTNIPVGSTAFIRVRKAGDSSVSLNSRVFKVTSRELGQGSITRQVASSVLINIRDLFESLFSN